MCRGWSKPCPEPGCSNRVECHDYRKCREHDPIAQAEDSFDPAETLTSFVTADEAIAWLRA